MSEPIPKSMVRMTVTTDSLREDHEITIEIASKPLISKYKVFGSDRQAFHMAITSIKHRLIQDILNCEVNYEGR